MKLTPENIIKKRQPSALAKAINTHFSPEDFERIVEIAEEEGMAPGAFVRYIMKKYIASSEND